MRGPVRGRAGTRADDMQEERDARWSVLSFFQTLEFSLDRSLVDQDDAIRMFGEVFVWWHSATLRAATGSRVVGSGNE